MPGDGQPDGTTTYTRSGSAEERAARVRFRRAVALMTMTLVLPGSAQIACGNTRVGRTALRLWFALLIVAAGCVVVAVFDHEFAFWLVSDLAALQTVRIALMVLAVGWAALFVDAWRLGQPLSLRMGHRRAAVGINGILCFSVASVLLFGAHLVGVQRDFIQTMFGSGDATGAHAGRYNVLLMGGDSGIDRWGLRPDSMTIASIDAETGRTVLISLPRNMQNFPFAKGSVMHQQFPHGFSCDHCMLNGVYTWALDNKQLFGKAKDPGIVATISAVEGITGLKMNYWAMVNLKGFRDLVDAVGGVTLNVRQRIPIGGLGSDVYDYIQPGVHKLTGFQTQWYARARTDSDDYSRMARQKCIMGAMLDQVDPSVVLRNFQKIAKASAAMVSTSIPASEVPRFMDLAMKAKDQKVSTLSIVPPIFDTYQPNAKLIHRKVAAAIAQAEGTAPKKSSDTVAASSGTGGEQAGGSSGKGTKSKQPETVTGGSIGSLSGGYAANESQDLDSAC